MWVIPIIFLPLFWQSITCQEIPGYSIYVVHNASVQEGLCVTIPCSFTAASRNEFRNSRGCWLKTPFTAATFVASNVKSKRVEKQNFHLTGNPDNGDCTLTITDARREDSGTYFFRFEGNNNNNSINDSFRSSMVSVNVTDLSDKPEISHVRRIVASEEVTLNCTSPGRCSGKSPQITWDGIAEKYGVTQRYTESREDGTMTYHVDLTFIPVIEDDQSLLTCTVTFENNVTTSRSIVLKVQGVTCHIIYIPGYSIEVNSSVSVQEGLCVTIPCNFTAAGKNTFSNSFGYWIRRLSNNVYTVATNDRSITATKNNFNLTGNPDRGDCTLTITDARTEDRGTYYFRHKDREGYGYSREISPTITVTDLTEEPVISDLGRVIAGVNKTVTCAPPGNCPATSLVIRWKKSDVPGIWRNSSTITFTPSVNDHQKNITCEMTNSRGKTTQKTLLLDVCSPPTVIIKWEVNGKKRKNSDNKVSEGVTLILSCSVESKTTLNVTWTDEKDIILHHGLGKVLNLTLQNVTMNHTGTYTCSVFTECVNNSTNITIAVQYPPRNMKINSSKDGELQANQRVVLDRNETLTLVCTVDGNPVSVVWVKGEVDVEKSENGNGGLSATINVTSSSAGVYRCLAWNALGVRDRYIRVGTKQDNSGAAAQPITSETISYRDTAIAFICGVIISSLIFLLYKLFTRKKMTKKKTYMRAEEQSASAVQTTDEIYMNVSKPERKTEEVTDNNEQLDSRGVTSNQDDLHYSTVAFAAAPSKVPSTQPEAEYAEVKKNIA
ncbi:sialic acid-binding Ig-like lectin 5 [Rhinoderma darwinii]|uniref:sialic acid-binding Ig-like lectin 5 n=1 Tax=Rhinoderma darwinii TaxID=43563 RepID=UPI003F66F031